MTVRERVAGRQARRVNHAGFNFFKQEYDGTLHRKSFAAFVYSLVAGMGPGSDALAAHLGHLLDPAPEDPMTDAWRQRRREWLDAFFRDEPAWEPRLRSWIQARLAKAEPGAGAS